MNCTKNSRIVLRRRRKLPKQRHLKWFRKFRFRLQRMLMPVAKIKKLLVDTNTQRKLTCPCTPLHALSRILCAANHISAVVIQSREARCPRIPSHPDNWICILGLGVRIPYADTRPVHSSENARAHPSSLFFAQRGFAANAHGNNCNRGTFGIGRSRI